MNLSLNDDIIFLFDAHIVIPAYAGIQKVKKSLLVDPRVRGDDSLILPLRRVDVAVWC